MSESTLPASNTAEHGVPGRGLPLREMSVHGVPPRVGAAVRTARPVSRQPRVSAGGRLTVLLSAAVFALVACGGGASSTTVAGSTAPAPGVNPAPAGPPGVTGTAAAVTDTTIQVQNPSVGQVAVNFTTSTAFTRTEQTTASSLGVGDCVLVTAASGTQEAGQPAATDAPVIAQNITISKPDAGKCTGNGASRTAFGGGARPSGAPNPSGGPQAQRSPRAGGVGRVGALFGTVTSKSDTAFVVETIARGDTPATTRTVTTGVSTVYDHMVPASAAVLKVGECVTAVGPADSTGAITATSINIRSAGPNGCTGGFRRQGEATGPANG
ncbi:MULTISPECIES: hypothetical protein [unclassified Frankia]|uniref:hypothetical protein n=1 Tax=unclassified Frankia TaxID=2632575 RepID=UPI001EF4D788|nr:MULTISPECIES: hypothetical protein [unclassified Frankia]